MHCGFTGLLGVAAGSLLVASEVFGISVWDTSHVVLVGDEQSPGLMTGIIGHQESLWFSLEVAVPSVCLCIRCFHYIGSLI